jgi:hypothetical protein
MNLKIYLSGALLFASLMSCSDSSTTSDPRTTSSQGNLSSLSDPLSSANPLSQETPISSLGGEIPLSSQIIIGTSSTDVTLSSVTLSSATLISSSATVALSSSAPPQDPTYYEKLTEANAQKGWGSRYWDACKPHCSQRDNVDTNAVPFSVCRNCDISGKEIPSFTLSPNVNQWWTGYEGTENSCKGGPAYACMDMAPIAVNDTLAYAYGATSKTNAQCGQCFQIQFDGGGHYGTKAAHGLLKGKTLIIMASNTGSDVEAGQFDIMIPGGGVGIFDALSTQLGVSKSIMGEQYGGLLTTCQKELNNYDLPADSYKTCVRAKCDAVFGGDPKFGDLLRGCHWFVDWMHAADNPTYLVKPVTCPAYLANKYPSTINTTKNTDIKAGQF